MRMCARERERPPPNRAINRATNDIIENFLIYVKGVSKLVSKYINKIK